MASAFSGHSSQSFDHSSHSALERSQSIPWDNFSSWISCICVVTFDLELGQVIEKVYPEHYTLTETEKSNICYLSFPDSNTGCMGDIQFHFRIRSEKTPRSISRHLDAALKKDFQHYYGCVSFRQVKDSTIKRGYFQKSLVVLSHLPFIDLYLYLAKIIAPEFFENGEVALETVCYQIDRWPCPYPGQSLHLPVMGEVIEVKVPINVSKIKPKPVKKTLPKEIQPSSFFHCGYKAGLFHCFEKVLTHLHLLWELVLLSEPLVVMAPSPGICSASVQSLISLISPLPYVCDYRPYFTIHDSELKEYTGRTHTPPNIILGVTNPFFAKTLQMWPHILRIGEMPSLSMNKKNKKSQESKPGVYTKYKPCLDRDKTLLKQLQKTNPNGSRPIEVQNAIVRNYMTELTQSFMIPLERYIGSLMPLQRSISPWRSPPKLRRFNIEEFIQTLPQYGPQLTSKMKGNWQALYRKFFSSPNFESWFEVKKKEVNQKLEILHLEALSTANLDQFLKSKDEVELVDLYTQMKLKIQKCRSLHISSKVQHDIFLQTQKILAALPPDLQEMIRRS
eukprot:TCONS_00013468-protein